MTDETVLQLLSLPASTLARVSQPAIEDVVEYFSPDIVSIPGPRNPTAYASVREATPDIPILHPQLGHGSTAIDQYRCVQSTGVSKAKVDETNDAISDAGVIDILVVQTGAVLDQLQRELETEKRQTNPDGATFLILPQLAVEWEPTTLSTTLPHENQIAAIASVCAELLVVLAGCQPAEYYHEWTLSTGDETITVPIAGIGTNNEHDQQFAQYTCTPAGGVAAEAADADQFGLGALHGIGSATAKRLRKHGYQTPTDLQDLAVSRLADLPGVGERRAEQIHAHADVIGSGEPLLLTNKSPVKTRDEQPPLCLDIETDGLSPTIIWQFGIYDPATDTYDAFIEADSPTNPKPVLEAFITWFIANHQDRTVLTWNGHNFDYPYIRQFLEQHLPAYVEAWDEIWKYDLYKWAVRDENALLPGRTNKLDHVARALGYDAAGTGLTGAQTAVAYQEFMRDPDEPRAEPDWDRHRAYCEDDCRALWHVYQAITNATRRDMTDSGSGGAAGQQAGLTDFQQ